MTKRMGAETGGEAKRRSHPISVRLPEELGRRLEALALAHESSQAVLIRQAVENFVEHEISHYGGEEKLTEVVTSRYTNKVRELLQT